MELLDEFLDLGEAVLENQITVVGLTLVDLAGDGGQHQVFNFTEIRGLAKGPGQLDVSQLKRPHFQREGNY